MRVQAACNGEEALCVLRRKEEYAERATPDLVVLDLNLPGKDGRA